MIRQRTYAPGERSDRRSIFRPASNLDNGASGPPPRVVMDDLLRYTRYMQALPATRLSEIFKSTTRPVVIPRVAALLGAPPRRVHPPKDFIRRLPILMSAATRRLHSAGRSGFAEHRHAVFGRRPRIRPAPTSRKSTLPSHRRPVNSSFKSGSTFAHPTDASIDRNRLQRLTTSGERIFTCPVTV
jgi:hypothetical protein